MIFSAIITLSLIAHTLKTPLRTGTGHSSLKHIPDQQEATSTSFYCTFHITKCANLNPNSGTTARPGNLTSLKIVVHLLAGIRRQQDRQALRKESYGYDLIRSEEDANTDFESLDRYLKVLWMSSHSSLLFFRGLTPHLSDYLRIFMSNIILIRTRDSRRSASVDRIFSSNHEFPGLSYTHQRIPTNEGSSIFYPYLTVFQAYPQNKYKQRRNLKKR